MRFDRKAFRSQYCQDRWVFDNVFSHIEAQPVFVEFGARNGLTNSNSHFYEAALNWSGLLLEAGVDDILSLRRNRRCRFRGRNSCFHAAVASATGQLLLHNTTCGAGECRRTVRTRPMGRAGASLTSVRSVSLNDVLGQLSVGRIGLLSADCEGCELEALSALDFRTHQPQFVLVEQGPPHSGQRAKLQRMLRARGYFELGSDGSPEGGRSLMFHSDGHWVSAEVARSLPPPCLDHFCGARIYDFRNRTSTACSRRGVWLAPPLPWDGGIPFT